MAYKKVLFVSAEKPRIVWNGEVQVRLPVCIDTVSETSAGDCAVSPVLFIVA